jgi:hypothetical protein
MYHATQWAGDLGLLVLAMLLMLATVAVATTAQRTLAHHKGAVFPWFLLTFWPTFGTWGSIVRSRTFTFLFVAVLYLVIVKWRAGSNRWLWILPPLFVLWANLHGGFLAGFALFGAATVAGVVERRAKALPLVLCLVASVLATLINPYGLDYWYYVVNAVAMERPGIQEWTPPGLLSWRSVLGGIYLSMFLVGSLKSKRKPSLQAWTLVAASMMAAIDARRFFAIFLLTLAVFGTDSAAAVGIMVRDRLRGWWEASRRLLGLTVIGLSIWCALLTIRHMSQVAREGLDYRHMPVEAMEWLELEGGGGNLLVHFDYGSYALWRLFPDYRVSVDGRYEEVYPQSTVDLSFQALRADDPGQEEALSVLDPDFAIVAAEGADEFAEGWDVVHRDDLFAVVAKGWTPAAGPVAGGTTRPPWQPGF